MPQVEDSGGPTPRPGQSLRLLAVIALVPGVACLALAARLTGLTPGDTLSPSCACATAPDPKWTPSPSPPVSHYLAALRLAMSSGQAAGETPYSVSQEPDWQVYPGSPDDHDFLWYVVFQDGVLAVDAASGEVWVMKWAQDLTAS
jgi:hypothetical protein